MILGMPEQENPIAEMFEKFFEAESTSARIRAAEPGGFDRHLWDQLVGIGVPVMRVPEASGGGGMTLLDACMMIEHAGRRLASAPLAEALCAARLLGLVGRDEATDWLSRISKGEAIVTLALGDEGSSRIVAGAEIADAVIVFDGSEIALIELHDNEPFANLGGQSLAKVELGQGRRTVLAAGNQAGPLWEAIVGEWKLLMATALLGLASQATAMAAEYASEREAFGVKIGTYQAISHPLANDVIDADGGLLFVRHIVQSLAEGDPASGAMIAQALWWAAGVATRATAHATHTYGGYGLTLEYDLQLYQRRAKAWVLAAGDPQRELLTAGRCEFLGRNVAVPDPGDIEREEDEPEHVKALARETREFFARTLTPELRAKAHYSFEGHDWGFHKALANAGLLYPEWPEEWGGRNADAASIRAMLAVWEENGWTTMPRGVTTMVARILMMFGSEELKREVLPKVAAGEVTISLGYTEPSGGSDVFAARTRAEREVDEWIINGQKMFTSGSEHASYVFLLARTNKDVPKHKGLTMFLVPLDSPGVEIQPVHTFMDERTNATFYADVRIPDCNRVGDIDGGVRVMGAALTLEQGNSSYFRNQRRMVSAVVGWAQERSRDGAALLEDPDVLRRLARTSTHANIGYCLAGRVNRIGGTDLPDLAYGPANKVFCTETFISDSADLLDLAAPDSLQRQRGGIGYVEESFRHATATSVYAGTSEVLRSMVAEKRLGMPRSRAK